MSSQGKYSKREIDYVLEIATLSTADERERLFQKIVGLTGIPREALIERFKALGAQLLPPGIIPEARRCLEERLNAIMNTRALQIERGCGFRASRLVSIADAARILGMHESTLRWWIRWLHVMEPDERGRVTLGDICRFLRSPENVLIPITPVRRRRAQQGN